MNFVNSQLSSVEGIVRSDDRDDERRADNYFRTEIPAALLIYYNIACL